jgi:hypothetical protein
MTSYSKSQLHLDALLDSRTAWSCMSFCHWSLPEPNFRSHEAILLHPLYLILEVFENLVYKKSY